jgi:hypothetical protein
MDWILGRPLMGCTVLDNVKPYWAIIRHENERAGHLAGLYRLFHMPIFLRQKS